jgi:SAM-dependent methyltransferase
MSNDSEFVTADYLRRAAEWARTLKAASYDHMAIEPGCAVLDAGCGPGVDIAGLAQRVGLHGRVIAVDADPAMIAEAQRVVTEQGLLERVELHVGSVLNLPLADGAVAASRAERLIQVLPPADAPHVVAELRRVTRPGGRIVLVDADWGTASVDFGDNALERRLMAFFAQRMRPNGFAGRRLFGLALEQGLKDVKVETTVMVYHGFDDTPLQWLGDTAHDAGMISAEEHRRWIDGLRMQEALGRLFVQTTMVTVAGSVPQV